MLRYVHLAIPTANGGSNDNLVNIAGSSFGWKMQITERVSLLPEFGFYWYNGKINGVKKEGPGFQYGIMFSTTL